MNSVAGAWRLLEYYFETDEGDRSYPWGESPVGWDTVLTPRGLPRSAGHSALLPPGWLVLRPPPDPRWRRCLHRSRGWVTESLPC